MDEIEYYKNLGFDSNPFQSTNAENEERLEKYFILPPYFDSVWGDPEDPRSVIVFAPRGGGKTAQRKMIEFQSRQSGKVLCVNYSRFEFSKDIDSITLSDHLEKIIQIIIIGILTKLNEEPNLVQFLNESDKKYLKLMIKAHLTSMSEQEFRNALESLSSCSEKAIKFWNQHFGLLTTAINGILLNTGLKPLELKKIDNEERLQDLEKYQLEKIQKITSKINFSSIYVLIDKVDESSITGNNAKLSSKLIEPLLKDLDLLEMKGYAFKFFLWDKLEPYCGEYSRRDRLNYYSLTWENEDLKKMLCKRLEAYSDNRINDFSKITTCNLPVDINSLIIRFAQKSPRNIIRIIQNIISEQREINQNKRKISQEAIIKGINNFSKNNAVETIPDKNILRDLKKVGQVEFTIRYLANEIYRCQQETVRSKMNTWRNYGVIETIGKEKGRNKPINKYCISDITVAKYILLEMPLEKFVDTKFKICPYCKATLLRDWDKKETKLCHHCSKEISFSDMIVGTKQKSILDFSGQKTIYDF